MSYYNNKTILCESCSYFSKSFNGQIKDTTHGENYRHVGLDHEQQQGFLIFATHLNPFGLVNGIFYVDALKMHNINNVSQYKLKKKNYI